MYSYIAMCNYVHVWICEKGWVSVLYTDLIFKKICGQYKAMKCYKIKVKVKSKILTNDKNTQQTH